MSAALLTHKARTLSKAVSEGSAEEVGRAVDELCRAVKEDLDVAVPLECLRSVASALDEVPDACLPGPRAEALVEVAYYLYLIRSFDGLGAATRSLQLARRSPDRRLLRKALVALAIQCADAGDVPRAIECYAEALDVATESRDLPGQATVYLNAGVALIYAAQYHDAIACLEHVIALSESSEVEPRFRESAYANLALCCLHLGEFERGLKAADMSLKGVPEPTTEALLVSHALRENYYARLLLEVGEIGRAGEHARRARDYAMRSRSTRAEIVSAVACGLHLLHAGRREEGMALLDTAAAQARERMPVMLRDCLRALAKAYDLAGLPQQAIGHLQESMEVARQWQCESALQNLRHLFPALDQENLGNAAFTVRLRGEEAALRGKVSRQELFRSPMEMLERMAVTAELRDDSGGEHCYRVGRLSALLAQEAGWTRPQAERIELAARLHDIGKIGVSDEIILKRARLTDAERQAMGAHTRVGADLLVKSNIPGIEMAAQIALHHHDWWDGSRGEGARGEGIPPEARIVSLAEVFDALTHARAHRSAWSMREALDEIASLKGRQFDPALADIFIALVRRVANEHRDFDAFVGEAARASGFLSARTRIREAMRESRQSL